ncbi:MAG: pyruvate, phosphate dikinase [Proteobacteria bacterium]|nr:pyruvate, phosphate dikinase [Pseudomonadota bacterium]
MIRWSRRFSGNARAGLIPPAMLVGAKGLGLIEMTALGLPVPPGFILTTDVCREYFGNNRRLPSGLEAEVVREMQWLESETGKVFGGTGTPLLVSVRSGAPSSMPGMLDTVLNLGMNEQTARRLAAAGTGESLAWDSYCRFIRMYGEVVLGLDAVDAPTDAVAGPEAAAALIEVVNRDSETPFPTDPWGQLWGAVLAVLDSWRSRRATTYRRLHDIPDAEGTAVTVQAMVFGNAGAESATGVAFSRDPSTGDPAPFGEYIRDAQGDDVVSGIRTPAPLRGGPESLEQVMPESYAELCAAFRLLERHTGAMQDVEFTIERGKLWLLQTRTGVTSTEAGLRIAVDMQAEGLLSREQALLRLNPASLGRVLHPSVRADLPRTILTRGLPASPGAASGLVALSSDEAEALAADGKPAVLVLSETHPRDVHGVHAAAAVLTARGGATSHAALVARGAGRPCVVGAGDIVVDVAGGSFRVGNVLVKRGDVVTIDGSSGEVSAGALELEQPQLSRSFATVLEWADDIRRLGVRANTASPGDVDTARLLGAEAIGLFRTEYSFLGPESLAEIQSMLLATDDGRRRRALVALEPLQRAAYRDLFTRAKGLPVTIRLLDLALSEFLPKTADEIAAAAEAAGISAQEAAARVAARSEANPALGHRGCRLAISQPDLYAVQVRAILAEAHAADSAPQILVPMVASAREFEAVRTAVADTAESLRDETGAAARYSVGASIELPRAVMQAARIADTADFFSIGTNNLTQTSFGVSRDDAAAFLERYRAAEHFAGDPFSTLDIDGVGALLEIAVERGRSTKPNLEIGVCGEHGGDPESIRFFNSVGLDYVSCSPYRVPAARLAAAQATLKGR